VVQQPAQEEVKSEYRTFERDEAAATVLSVGYFTALHILFAILLVSPSVVVIVAIFGEVEDSSVLMTANIWEFIVATFVLYLLVLLTPFANLLWVMLIKLFLGGHIYKNDVTPGVYPKWSKMHLRVWCIGRMESIVLLPLRRMYRSAPLTAFVLRQLGASVGKNLQCAPDAYLAGPADLISIGDDVCIQTGAYIQVTGWLGQHLQVGSVHLEHGCKIGMRAAVASNVTVGRGTWVTPFTPILTDVGSDEMWEGAPARLSGRCTELQRTANACHYAYPIWLLETLNILLYIFTFFWTAAVPTAAIVWFARGFLVADISSPSFRVTPLLEIVWHITSSAFVTTWITVVATSVVGCLFIRFTAASPGLYPSRGLKGALLMYRMNRMNVIQKQWNWTITGQYLRALAGVRFPRLGASECDVMMNLVPEATSADSHVFWSSGCFTNMLDYGAEHFKLRQLDMPRNFFSGNNSVAESGHFPSNFLLGVSTPVNEIQFRQQMRSRPGAPIVAAGNPPLRFARSSSESEDETSMKPSFALFLTRVFLNDLFSIGILPITELLVFTTLYICSMRLGALAMTSAITALFLTELVLVLFCVTIKKVLIGSKWGIDDSTPFWSWQHFAYFFVQDCFFIWCRAPLLFCAGTVLANSILRWMGCRIGKRTIVKEPMQCFDWNAVNVGDDFTLLRT
jgi:non-ribosomal peptide synthetase-like protein